jgi:hypothetical protein
MTEQGWPAHYEITIGGVLDDRWSAWFEGLSTAAEADRTVLSGLITDEAELHGLMAKVRDLGLPLISVCRRGGDAGREGAAR